MFREQHPEGVVVEVEIPIKAENTAPAPATAATTDARAVDELRDELQAGAGAAHNATAYESGRQAEVAGAE